MTQRLKKILPNLTIAGIGIYILFFSIAAYKFPGGNVNDVCHEGFSFCYNYWCDLMGSVCQIGVENAARPFAITGHIIICLTLILLFISMPFLFEKENRNSQITRILGTIAMLAMMFVFTDWHEVVIVAFAVLGTAALIPFFVELERSEHRIIRNYAYCCFAFCLMIFIIYQTGFGVYWLGLLQKVALIFCIGWILLVSWTIRKTS